MPLRFRTLTIGLYGKHLTFWVVAAVVFVGSYRLSTAFLTQKQRSEASLITTSPVTGPVAKQTLELSLDGTVTLDGQTVSRALTVLPNSLELRYKVLDQPGFGISTHIIDLKFPKPIDQPPLSIKDPLIIHTTIPPTPIAKKIDQQTYRIETANLGPDTVYTVVVEMPKDYLHLPLWFTLANRYGTNILIWLTIGLTLPLVGVIIMLIFIYHVHHSRKIVRLKQPVTAPPSQLPPAVVGLLTRGKISNRDIAATLIDLAWRGFLELYSSDDQFSLVKKIKLAKAGITELHILDKKPNQADRLLSFERALTNKIFYPGQYVSHESDVMFRVGHRLFSQKIARVYIGIYDLAYETGLFVENPAKIHQRFVSIGLSVFFVSLIGFTIDSLFFSGPTLLFWVGALSAGVVITQLGSLINPLSEKGKQELARWLAFKKYLSSSLPIDSQSASQQIFEHYLPYAVVFGVEKEWVNRFADHPFTVPDWFSAADSVITLEMFAQRLFAMIATTSRLLMSAKDPSVQ